MNNPLVSVLIISYNYEEHILYALNSILNQTYKDIQILIADNHSADNSIAIIEKWISDNKIKCIFIKHDKNLGVCKVINELIKMAKGEYICMLSSDDYFMPNRIEKQVKIFESLPAEAGIIYGDIHVIDDNNKIIERSYYKSFYGTMPPSGDIFKYFLINNPINALGLMLRSKVFEKTGYYDENLLFEDYDMHMRLARDFKYQYHNDIVGAYRRHKGQFSDIYCTDPDKYTLVLKTNFSTYLKHINYSEYRPILIKRIRGVFIEMIKLNKLTWREKARYSFIILKAEHNMLNLLIYFLCLTNLIYFAYRCYRLRYWQSKNIGVL